MNTRNNPALAVVIDELRNAGAIIDDTVQNRHIKIFWRLNNQKCVTIVSVTSNTYASNHAKRDVRRQLRGASL
jgi:hypothetical protein